VQIPHGCLQNTVMEQQKVSDFTCHSFLQAGQPLWISWQLPKHCCEISGFHSEEGSSCGLLGYDAM